VLLTNHVLSGALIGGLVRRPVTAFTLGVASHFALDAVPHWGRWGGRRRFLRIAVADGLVGLAAMGVLVAVSPPARRKAVLAGMVGAALPDMDKPTMLWFGWSPWPAAVNKFHGVIQHEANDRGPLEFLAACALAAAALTAVRHPVSPPPDSPPPGSPPPREPAALGHVAAGPIAAHVPAGRGRTTPTLPTTHARRLTVEARR
jgi:hypothetical protein